MKKLLNTNQIQEGIQAGWKKEDVINGYGIFTSDYMNGALHIELIGDVNDIVEMYDSDQEASVQAELDGIKIIRDLPLEAGDKDYGYFIDTEENRELIGKYLYKNRKIDWNNYSLDHATDYQLY